VGEILWPMVMLMEIVEEINHYNIILDVEGKLIGTSNW
jgi:hypothetical protein